MRVNAQHACDGSLGSCKYFIWQVNYCFFLAICFYYFFSTFNLWQGWSFIFQGFLWSNFHSNFLGGRVIRQRVTYTVHVFLLHSLGALRGSLCGSRLHALSPVRWVQGVFRWLRAHFSHAFILSTTNLKFYRKFN